MMARGSAAPQSRWQTDCVRLLATHVRQKVSALTLRSCYKPHLDLLLSKAGKHCCFITAEFISNFCQDIPSPVKEILNQSLLGSPNFTPAPCSPQRTYLFPNSLLTVTYGSNNGALKSSQVEVSADASSCLTHSWPSSTGLISHLMRLAIFHVTVCLQLCLFCCPFLLFLICFVLQLTFIKCLLCARLYLIHFTSSNLFNS